MSFSPNATTKLGIREDNIWMIPMWRIDYKDITNYESKLKETNTFLVSPVLF